MKYFSTDIRNISICFVQKHVYGDSVDLLVQLLRGISLVG
jgi:hypothetical protein